MNLLFRQYSASDRIVGILDSLLKTITHTTTDPSPTYPAEQVDNAQALTPKEQQHSASLLRVDHSGEVCAQALYLGQACMARSYDQQKYLLTAAKEESYHLNWCARRLNELGARASYLNLFWGSGAFLLGAIAGCCGDQWSLGFLAETEHQVTEHLEKQLNQISPFDLRSRVILETMKKEEQAHGQEALNRGGKPLPGWVKFTMQVQSTIMIKIAGVI